MSLILHDYLCRVTWWACPWVVHGLSSHKNIPSPFSPCLMHVSLNADSDPPWKPFHVLSFPIPTGLCSCEPDLSPWEFDVLIHVFQMGMVADRFFFFIFRLGDKIRFLGDGLDFLWWLGRQNIYRLFSLSGGLKGLRHLSRGNQSVHLNSLYFPFYTPIYRMS